MKTFLKIGAVIVVLFVIVLMVAIASLDRMIKAGVEAVGPEITGTTVKLDGVSLSLLSGQGRLKGLVIGNPSGFQTPQAFKLTDARVSVDLKSILSDKLIIEEILIDGPDITFELNPSGSNIGKLQGNVTAFGRSSGAKEASGAPAQKDTTQKKVQINHFILKNAQVHASAPMLQQPTQTLALPDIHLQGLGKEPAGTTVQKAAVQVFTAINTTTIQTVANSSKLLQQGVGMADDAAKRLGGESGSKALEGVKGLLGK
jgi:uncharacterized protein involved in outer membrane biogenesis